LSEIFVKILIVHETSDFFQVQVISQVESNNIARDDMIFSKRSNAKLYRPVLNDQGFQSSQNGFPADSYPQFSHEEKSRRSFTVFHRGPMAGSHLPLKEHSCIPQVLQGNFPEQTAGGVTSQ